MLKKIVIIGPESTGKSTLCGQLAAHYNTLWAPEFAREYLLANGMNYTYDDLLTIAKGQIVLEEKIVQSIADQFAHSSSANRFLPVFIDTDMYVMKVWCEFVFEKCHRWILHQIIERKYDLYLLCNVDLPWMKDELREYPQLESRLKLYNMYKDLLVNQSVPWADIIGSHTQRLQKAIAAVDECLSK